MPPTALLLAASPEDVPSHLRALAEVRELPRDGIANERMRGDLEASDCVMVLAPTNLALAAIRRLHGVDASLQTILLVPPSQRHQVERALLFTPGLGEVWLHAPDELDADVLERAALVTRQRRQFRSTRRRLEDFSTIDPQRGRRALVSDAYLAVLLRVLPDPVLSIDAGDRVLSWNPAAERLFGYTSSEAVGRSVLEVLAPIDPPALELALAEAAEQPRQLQLELRKRDGEQRTAEIHIVPVEASGHRVRSIVLHDITEQQRVQTALEEQANEMEAQTTELERLNGELQLRTQALEEAITSRSRFYASMSHELRTPMNAIIGYNSLLLDEVFGPLSSAQMDAVRRAQRAANHLLELVNDVLDLAKVEAGRIELQPEKTCFPQVLEELLDTILPMAEEKGVPLTLKDSTGPPHVIRTDPRRVRQILLNLLSNAIKFGEGKPVYLAWQRLEDGGVRIDVIDQGKGIPPEDVARIFDEFVQVASRDGVGTGLGLSISRRLAEALGGRLEVDSTPGEGSTFSLVLPQDRPVEAW